MKDAQGKEVQLGDRIAVSVGRRGTLRFGKVTSIVERKYQSYGYNRASQKYEPIEKVGLRVNYDLEGEDNQWRRRGLVKKNTKFVVIP